MNIEQVESGIINLSHLCRCNHCGALVEETWITTHAKAHKQITTPSQVKFQHYDGSVRYR